MTTEMWLLKDFKITDCIENIVEKGEIEQFHRFPQSFPKAFFFSVLKHVYMEERVLDVIKLKAFSDDKLHGAKMTMVQFLCDTG